MVLFFDTCSAVRELINFWPEEMSTSYSYSAAPTYRPRPYDPKPVLDFPGFDVYGSMSMSMSMPMPVVYNPTLPEDVNVWWPIEMSYSYSYSMPANNDPATGDVPQVIVDDAGVATDGAVATTEETTADGTGGEAEAVGGGDTDTTAAKNFGHDTGSSDSSGASTLQNALLLVLVGAAMAVLSAWYVRKNQRASSNASQMTPASAPLV